MHTVWKGAISFGLVHIPVKMHSAIEDKDITMKYIHKECGTNLSYIKSCKACEKEVSGEDIVKGYEYENGKFVIFNKDEIEEILPENTKEIKILDFVDLHEIDPVYFQKTYYLSPGDTSAKAYYLLYEAIRTKGKIGICKVIIRSKSSLAALRIIDHCLVMETIYYPDEIRPVQQVPNLKLNMEVSEMELKMAHMLIDHLSKPFDPNNYQDDYREELTSLIQKKINGEEFHVSRVEAKSNILDLMSALQASLSSLKPKNEVGKPKRKTTRKKKESAVVEGTG
ncbi:Ku protein [Paenibacillus psychroresistens]|uniref:Non-homologous end joining protein Ku n=1 Tax=Paenibacillus psychroresistens TaxID=1778678 RepID=A0A6B8RKW8_9BACL|nr:Ku protein [Paenibacillus psychroresistens]QGQ97041.1 Ku protein [Paenibacillus psychroresistens]